MGVDPIVASASLNSSHFQVSEWSELTLEDITFEGNTTIHVQGNGLLELSSSIASQPDKGGNPFLINEGNATLNNVLFLENSVVNNLGSSMEISYSTFYNQSNLENFLDGRAYYTYRRSTS